MFTFILLAKTTNKKVRKFVTDILQVIFNKKTYTFYFSHLIYDLFKTSSNPGFFNFSTKPNAKNKNDERLVTQLNL